MFLLVVQARKKMGKDKGGAAAAADKSNVSEMKPWPSFIEERIKLWDQLKDNYAKELDSRPKQPIKVTLPDGKQVDGVSWETTAYDVAKSIRFVLISKEQVLIIRLPLSHYYS